MSNQPTLEKKGTMGQERVILVFIHDTHNHYAGETWGWVPLAMASDEK